MPRRVVIKRKLVDDCAKGLKELQLCEKYLKDELAESPELVPELIDQVKSMWDREFKGIIGETVDRAVSDLIEANQRLRRRIDDLGSDFRREKGRLCEEIDALGSRNSQLVVANEQMDQRITYLEETLLRLIADTRETEGGEGKGKGKGKGLGKGPGKGHGKGPGKGKGFGKSKGPI
tara:strand:- start:94 stop:624 length:531 start_codon:yes stop_codon:yes gene_type:complete